MEATATHSIPLKRTLHPTIAILAVVVLASHITIQILSDTAGLGWLYLLMLIQATPFLFMLSTGRPSYLAYVMLSHLITYSIAKYNSIITFHKLDYLYPEAEYAIKFLVLCSILIIVSYLAVYSLIKKEEKQFRMGFLPLNRTQVQILALYVILNPILIRYAPASAATVNFVFNLIALILIFSSSSPGNEMLMRLAKIGVVASSLHFFLYTGSLALLATIGSMYFWTSLMRRRFKDILGIILFIPIVVSIQPIKPQYRDWMRNATDLGVMERLGTLSELIELRYFGPEEAKEYFDDYAIQYEEDQEEEEVGTVMQTLLYGFGRIGDDSLERVLDWTPSRVPFWGGETYANVPFMFIPRILWPGKPTYQTWNKFGRLYGFLSPTDRQTSVGVGFIGEAYMNFGFLGMLTCAVFFGALVAFMERISMAILNGRYIITFLAPAIPLMMYASDLSSMINSIFIVTVALFLLRAKMLSMLSDKSKIIRDQFRRNTTAEAF